ncbi:YkyA family protein [Planococcus soli]|uniref:YkyA family protein n=1 Tax=Planococcus soli TaxID=2666072 RepID=UPI001FCFCF23|nr:YkyA family protein [Planococcus soli]
MKRFGKMAMVSSLLMLAACSGSGIREDLDQVLNETFDAEEDYRSVQGDLEEREKAEQLLFEETMALTQEQQGEVADQAQEALDSADERLGLLQTEKDSMQAAEENFAEIDSVIESAEEESVIADLEALKAQMLERFAAHDEFSEAYEELIARQKELYEMLQDDQSTLEILQEKAAEVNEQNEQVQLAVTEFNELTQQVNGLKDSTLENLSESEE